MTLPDLRRWNKFAHFGDGSDALIIRQRPVYDPRNGIHVVQFELLPTVETAERYDLASEMTEDKTVFRKFPDDMVHETFTGVMRGKEFARYVVFPGFQGEETTKLCGLHESLHMTIRRLERTILTLRRALAGSQHDADMFGSQATRAAMRSTLLLQEYKKAIGPVKDDEKEKEEEA